MCLHNNTRHSTENKLFFKAITKLEKNRKKFETDFSQGLIFITKLHIYLTAHSFLPQNSMKFPKFSEINIRNI